MSTQVDLQKNSIRQFLKEQNELQTTLGKVNIGKEIGQGGNALVYSATWGRTDVAIKFLAEDCSESFSARYHRFITEVREIIKLSHTGTVVPIYFFDFINVQSHRFPYMIMKKYPLTLNEWIKTNRIESIELLLPLLKQLIDSLELIHSYHIIHRDIKPQNILVDDENNIVLSDFGISWFDPIHYERLVKTDKRERLANYAFSAPEQFHINPEPRPTMDLFALGQLIQWLVTGFTVRGTGRVPLKAVDDSFAPLDLIVDGLLQQDPSNRPQSTIELRKLLSNAFRKKEPSEYEKVLNMLQGFDEILRLGFPGKRGLIRITEKEKINEILRMLSEQSNSLGLWWTQGSSDCPIHNCFRQLNEETWLIDYGEHIVEELWVKKDFNSLDHQYILLQCAPMPSFGIYDETYKYEEAAWFIDRYITREEYDDGVADIDGKSVKLEGRAELRTREMKRDFLFIGTYVHPINVDRNRDIVDEVYEELVTNEEIEPEILERLDRLKRHEISQMMQ